MVASVASRQSRATMAANDHTSPALPVKIAYHYWSDVRWSAGNTALASDERWTWSCNLYLPKLELRSTIGVYLGRNREFFAANGEFQ
jgi:hypothetical protein